MPVATTPRHAACDRRTARSRKAFRDALAAEVLVGGDLSQVTATAVAERSGLTRRTFYTHYRDVPDLVRQIEDDILADLVDIVGLIAQSNLEDLHERLLKAEPAAGAVELLAYFRANGELLSALMGPGGDPGLAARMEQVARDAVIERASEGLDLPDAAQPFIDYYVTSVVASVLGVLRRWTVTGMKESDEIMARLLTALAFVRPGDLYGKTLDFDLSSYALSIAQKAVV